MKKVWYYINKFFRNKTLNISQVEFICEQDGVSEGKLKFTLSELFKTKEEVLRAYLVKVRYDKNGDSSVALCIKKIAGDDAKLAEEIGNIFFNQSNSKMFLDTMFIDDEKENRIKSVANAFYQRN